MKSPKGGLSSTLESYLELISDLQQQYRAVRLTDLAERMGCKTPSATSALRRLSKLGLINYQAYRPVTLTKEGKSAIKRLSLGHHLLADLFLAVLALPSEFADEEACSLEHRVSQQLLTRVAKFLDFMRVTPEGSKLLEGIQRGFKRFLEKSSTTDKSKSSDSSEN